MTKARGQARASGFQDRPFKQVGICPVCGKGNLDVTGDNIGCWSCEADGLTGGDYLRAVAERIDCAPWQVKADPLTRLGPFLNARRGGSRPTYKRVTEAQVCGWASRLTSDDRALAWLKRRGVSAETIRDYRLGYDGDADAIVIPIYEAGALVAAKRRFLDPSADPKAVNTPGRARLYPDVPVRGGVLLVAGELDALIGRQMGLPTVSTTCGARLPEHLAPALARRRVFVLFDVGEEAAARAAAQRALDVGADACVLSLANLGLPHGGDLNDLYLAGGTKRQVYTLARRARKAA